MVAFSILLAHGAAAGERGNVIPGNAIRICANDEQWKGVLEDKVGLGAWLMGLRGIEPPAHGLGNRCSIH
jgi:hypothetical protein